MEAGMGLTGTEPPEDQAAPHRALAEHVRKLKTLEERRWDATVLIGMTGLAVFAWLSIGTKAAAPDTSQMSTGMNMSIGLMMIAGLGIIYSMLGNRYRAPIQEREDAIRKILKDHPDTQVTLASLGENILGDEQLVVRFLGPHK